MPQTPINVINNKTLNPGVANTGNVNWVSGLNGGKSWKMYPNTTDILLDNVNKDIFYIKSCDETGAIKTFRAFKYNEIQLDEVPLQDADTPGFGNFVTKDDLAALKSEILEAIKGSNNSNSYHKNNRKQNYSGGSQNDNMGRGSENSNQY